MRDQRERFELSGDRYAEILAPDVHAQYIKDFPGTEGSRLFRINPCGTIVYEGLKCIDKEVYDFKFRSDDVLVMSYPKCGSTWTQEIIWTMMYNPNLDHPDPNEPLLSRSPVIESDMSIILELKEKGVDHFVDGPMFSHFRRRCPKLDSNRGIHLQMADSYEDRRILKTHLPFSCYRKGLIEKCKVILCVRHPKDVVLSYQHHCKLLANHKFNGTQDTFINYFVKGLLIWGSQANLLKEAFEYKDHHNLHIMFYEDMKKDIDGELHKLNKFLELNLDSQQLKNVQKQTAFKKMQEADPYKMMSCKIADQEVAERDGPFIRQGEAGAWKGKLTPEQEKILDDYIVKNFTHPDLVARYFPKMEVSPVKKEASPKKQEASPKKQEASPKKQEASPTKQEASPTKQEASPTKKEPSPKKKDG
ncbi:sulfotransferase 1A1 [Hyalella azteca]|uniref:Sulfotransferase 1A1 n=1 Tax=Hyalella azteca TaxID=294128 RepID=A0A8B7PSS2_HYAAZ|nr:sulfotransferase 1A1 [Hyalella azteca]